MGPNELTMKVEGMTCGHCARTVENAAKSAGGVTGARVDLASKTLTLQGTPDVAAVRAAVQEAGYDVEG